jgi:hypothetical protein
LMTPGVEWDFGLNLKFKLKTVEDENLLPFFAVIILD